MGNLLRKRVNTRNRLEEGEDVKYRRREFDDTATTAEEMIDVDNPDNFLPFNFEVPSSQMAEASTILTDVDLVKLTERIASEDDLVKIGITGLKLPFHEIQAALTNHPKDIQSAAREVLRGWLKRQNNQTEAFSNLFEALQRCKMNILASQLKQRDEGVVAEEPNMSRLEQIQEWNRQSLMEKSFSTAKGKIWTDTPSSIPLEKIFTKLSWVVVDRETHRVTYVNLPDIIHLLNNPKFSEKDPVRILVRGQGGIGKSTAMKHLAQTWAAGNVDKGKLLEFHFVFHISLNNVKAGQPIETIIVNQHKGLKGNDVHPDEIRNIIKGHTKQKVLILLDGHDEYRPGTNEDIDQAISKEYLRHCWIILTSRETKKLRVVREHIDAEALITGFDKTRVKEYITKYLGSNEKCEELIETTRKSGIHTSYDYGFLSVPILLHMICVLYLRKISLPRTTTGILEAVVDRCIDWDAIRKNEEKKVKDMKDALIKLGKLVMIGLQGDELQQIFYKDEILQNVGPEAFELGLLMGTECDPREEEQTQIFVFHHLLLLEFVAANYVATLDKASLQDLFPNWDSIMKHKEVIRFTYGLTAQKQSVLELVYEALLQGVKRGSHRYGKKIFYVHEDEEAAPGKFPFLPRYSAKFLQTLLWEASESTDMNRLQNKYFRYMDTQYIPSEKLESLQINKDIKCVKICRIPLQTLKHMAHQLYGCNELVLLDLSYNESVPIELGESFRTMTSLDKLSMEICHMTPDVAGPLLSRLYCCTNLVELNLSGNTLTNCMEKMLKIRNHISFPSLKFLHLIDTHLNRNDLQSISAANRDGYVPELTYLDISHNVLTDCVSELFCSPHNPGYLHLKVLCLNSCCLSKDDVVSMTDAVRTNKLAKIQSLHMEHSRLPEEEETVNELVQTCLQHYRKEGLKLFLTGVNVLGNFSSRMRSLCDKTNIDIRIS